MIKNLIQELGVTKLAVLLGVVFVIILGIVFVSYRVTTPRLVSLYSNLPVEDVTEITEKLDSMNVQYELRGKGDQVFVSADRLLRIRMELAKEGLPASSRGTGYELFDQGNTLGTSSFIHNVNMKRALEGELSRTIGSFELIDKARVHIVAPKKELFSKEKSQTTASIILTMKRGADLSKSQIGAIGHLVSTAVPNLNIENITIVDTEGRPFKLGAMGEDDPGYFAATTEEFRRDYEKKIVGIAKSLLEKIVGDGRVEVRVTADIDFDRVVTNAEIFDPEGSVVRSVQTNEDKESSQDTKKQTNVTIGNNLPDYTGQDDDVLRKNEKITTNETTNYEITKTVKNHIKETGSVNRLSVAVLVDGIYTIDEETDEVTYAPRGEEELQSFKTLVKSAIGFDASRGDTIEVMNHKFMRGVSVEEKEGPYDWLKRELANVLQTFIIAVVVVLVIVFIIRPMVNRAFEITRDEAEEIALSDTFDNIDPMEALKEEFVNISGADDVVEERKRIEVKVNSAVVNSINDAVDSHPRESVNLLREWMYSDKT